MTEADQRQPDSNPQETDCLLRSLWRSGRLGRWGLGLSLAGFVPAVALFLFVYTPEVMASEPAYPGTGVHRLMGAVLVAAMVGLLLYEANEFTRQENRLARRGSALVLAAVLLQSLLLLSSGLLFAFSWQPGSLTWVFVVSAVSLALLVVGLVLQRVACPRNTAPSPAGR